MNLHDSPSIKKIIDQCCQGQSKAQYELFKHTYPYAMGICFRKNKMVDQKIQHFLFKAFFFTFSINCKITIRISPLYNSFNFAQDAIQIIQVKTCQLKHGLLLHDHPAHLIIHPQL